MPSRTLIVLTNRRLSSTYAQARFLRSDLVPETICKMDANYNVGNLALSSPGYRPTV